MGKHTFFLALAFAVIIGLCSKADALMLDYPHNVDNGIKCYHCHSADSAGIDYWYDPVPAGDPDLTTYNWVCYNRCHAGAASTTLNSTHIGPEKKTHSKTTTGSTRVAWTTNCTDCHDPHFQEQINWALDGESIYIAQGTYDFSDTVKYPSGVARNETDIWDPENGQNGRGAPGIGTSTIDVNLPNHVNDIYDPADTANVNWAAKGAKGNDPLTGNPWNTRAGDGSRGLILVGDTNAITTTRTFEIIEMVDLGANNFTMTVKGDLSGIAGNGVPFGVIYGDLLGEKVKTPETYTDAKGVVRNVRRPVKFYSPKKVLDGVGGPVDLTPGVTQPVGMCQVCHTQTVYFDNNSEETVHNPNAGTNECDDCHSMVTGGSGSTNHATFIADDQSTDLVYNCSGCHAALVTSPDSGHPTCETCHTASRPEINLNAFNATGNPPDTGASVQDALIDASKYANDSQTYILIDNPADSYAIPRVQDSAGKFVTDTGFVPIICGECHDAKPQGLTDAAHGYYDHATNPAGGLAYAPITASGDCTTCHAGEVVTGVHAGTCATCHTATPPDLKSTPNLAQFAGTTTACTDCHSDTNNTGFTVNFHGVAWGHAETTTRHNNLQGSDSSGGYDCAACHTDMSTATLKLQKHMVTDTVANCYRCHYPSTWGALADTPAQTVITNGKGTGLAQNCEDCHTGKGIYKRHGLTDDGLADDAGDAHDKFLAESGTATSTCGNCHSALTSLARVQLHTTNGTGAGNCLTCHQSTIDMDPGTATLTAQDIIDAGKGTGGANQNCDSCHISINTSWDNHVVDHAARVTADTNCTSCHDGNPGTNTTAPNSVTTPYTGATENHNPTGCYTCHDNSAATTRGNYLALAAANVKGYVGAMPVGPANCSQCHIAYFDSHAVHTSTAGHDVTFNATPDQTNNGFPCNSCHGADGADVGTVVLDSWEEITTLHVNCAKCHSYDGLNGVYNNTPSVDVDNAIKTGTGNTCVTCHTDKDAPADHGYYDHATNPAGGLAYAP
ncbi:MAG: hypothetical protein P1P81_02325, partial [Desulfobulbales bacterium]|nr:hypothetical protein [Desulfobulbales bacterium]